jgi:hypothetical protein
MSFFAYHYIEGVLVESGGPKRKSFFSSEAVFDSNLVDTVAEQMIDYASALGACRSKIALQIISNMFKDKDWDSNDSPKILDFINKREEWKTENILAPHEIIKLPSFVEHFGKTISVSDLKKMQSNLEQEFLFALLWGLANPDKFKLWFEKKFTEDKKILEVAQKAGLDVDSIPTLQEYLLACDKVIKNYEQKMGNLPTTLPSKLIIDAEKLGVFV